MKKFVYIFAIAILIPSFAKSQGMIDAFRLSSQHINGTARAAAMGNAFGALGGDFTSLSINPAGIAIYRSSEFVITPSIRFNKSETRLGNQSFMDNRYQLKFNNVGYVGFIANNSPSSKIVNFNFGIGVNDVSDYNQNFYVETGASAVSFLDGIVNWANSEALSNTYLKQVISDIEFRDWPTKLAWETYLIDPVEGVDGQYTNILFENEKVKQSKTYGQRGGIKEYVISGGMNINHTVYLGATLGIHDVSMSQLTDYTELLEGNNSFTFTENQYLDGAGYNLKLGLIYRPTNSFRLGFAYHTPTYYNLTDEARLSMQSKLDKTRSSEGINTYEYDFYTPMKAILSGAVIINKKALVSVDGEFVDYSSMRFRNGGSYGEDNFTDLNSQIPGVYKGVINLRTGVEYKVTPQFSLRGGYEVYGNPYKLSNTTAETTLSNNSSVLSCGAGFASKGFFFDVAYRQSNSKYTLYSPQPNLGSVALNNTNNKVLFTLGFKF
ncbi:MAG: hypothetical protein GXO81_06595 [Chlorobi bacterium]|nr:hypothetical protein [Chlorobiota bacterium]